MRKLSVALLVLGLLATPAGAEREDEGGAVKPEVLMRALAAATPYPTATVAAIRDGGNRFPSEGANVPWPLVLSMAAGQRAFELELLEGDRLDGEAWMSCLLEDAKAEDGTLPEVAWMLMPRRVERVDYDPTTQRGEIRFVVGGRIRLYGTFETEGRGDDLAVTLLRLPDSGWGAERREDGTWKMLIPWSSGPVRGIYGGMPETMPRGVTAIWIGERGITTERVRRCREAQVTIYAEFNTLHRAEYLKEHPDAAPVGPDGKRADAPHGWQGICPTHMGYRTWRMDAFRKLITDYAVDGVWLDYHHAHAAWERADPVLPDTCFCPRCLKAFQADTGIALGDGSTPERSKRLLGELNEAWVTWRCAVFTDWVQAFDDIRKKSGRRIALGSFHCPWTDAERDGALRKKLAIDLKAQSRFLDVLSPMPYHARFGHADDPAWISRQTAWLSRHLDLKGHWGESTAIWPIVQLKDWGEPVPAAQVPTILEHGLRKPSGGVIVFTWGGIRDDPEKLAAMSAFFGGY